MTALNTIRLSKMYPMAKGDDDRDDDWGAELWKFLSSQIAFTVDTSPLRGEHLSGLIRERFINHVMARLTVAGCYATDGLQNPSDMRYTRLEAAVELVLDVGDDFRSRVVWYLDRICTRILKEQAKLTSPQTAKIRKFAGEQSHRCYLCGRSLHYPQFPFGNDEELHIEEIRQKRTFEIEHIWAQARGGSRARDNLAASCNECNKVKKDSLSPADFPVESYLGWATKDDSVKTLINNQVRVAIFWRQQGACALCNQKFYSFQTEVLYLVHREEDQPFHFFNMMICCEDCHTSNGLTGVKIR